MTLTTVTTTPTLRSLLLTSLCTVCFFLSPASAHMDMKFPVPWDSSEAAIAANRNYDIKSPLQGDGSDFPCKGIHQASGNLQPSANYQAGQTYNMTLEGYANHNGGSCQLSLSYDKGKTWRVIKSIIGGCPKQGGGTYDFQIPASAPSGTALFAWTWINHTGNREFYMNCAMVNIQGQQTAGGNDLCGLPSLYVANLKGINNCISPEGIDTMFPHPGMDVEYGDGMSASAPVTGGAYCELPAPGCSSSNSQQQQQQQQSVSPSAQGSGAGPRPSNSQNAATPSRVQSASGGPGAQGSGMAMAEIGTSSTGAAVFTSEVNEFISSILGTVTYNAALAGPTLTSMVYSYISSVLGASSTGWPAGISMPATVTAPIPPVTPIPTPTSVESPLIESYISSVLASFVPLVPNTNLLPLPSSNLSTYYSIVQLSQQPTLDGPQATATPSNRMPPKPVTFAAAASQVTSGSSCPPRPIVTQIVTAAPPAATCSAPVVRCNCAPPDYCSPINDCTTTCVNGRSTLSTVVMGSSSTPGLTTTAVSTYQSSSPTPPQPSSSSGAHPPYVPTDPNTPAYLPCTPGAFLCASPTSFYTCNQPAAAANVSAALAPNGWAWGWLRGVAPGMLCLPFESSAVSAARNGTTTARDDRYVRARPNGECGTDGGVQCLRNGTAFEVCDHGGWVDMGDVAAGTRCVGGGIVLA